MILRFLWLSVALTMPGCALAATQEPVAVAPVTQPAPAPAPQEPSVQAQTPEPLTQTQAAAEADRLRAALAKDVPESRGIDRTDDLRWIGEAHAALAKAGQTIDRPQLLVMVDRSPRVQAMRLLMAAPDDKHWQVIGGTHVSTGQTGRFDHYVTPVGVFPHTDAILDFRAEGTFNENHIRGFGLAGMRIWDFGWQTAQKGWLADQSGPMRLLMHATDPAYLEHRIGARASSGCVRIPANLNIFLDKHGVLDFDYERMAATERRFRWLLRKDREPTGLAGTLMIVVDSSPLESQKLQLPPAPPVPPAPPRAKG